MKKVDFTECSLKDATDFHMNSYLYRWENRPTQWKEIVVAVHGYTEPKIYFPLDRSVVWNIEGKLVLCVSASFSSSVGENLLFSAIVMDSRHINTRV